MQRLHVEVTQDDVDVALSIFNMPNSHYNTWRYSPFSIALRRITKRNLRIGPAFAYYATSTTLAGDSTNYVVFKTPEALTSYMCSQRVPKGLITFGVDVELDNPPHHSTLSPW